MGVRRDWHLQSRNVPLGRAAQPCDCARLQKHNPVGGGYHHFPSVFLWLKVILPDIKISLCGQYGTDSR